MVGDGRKRKVEAVEVAERIAPRSAPGCRWRRWTSRRQWKSRRWWRNNAKGLFISCTRQLVAGGHQAGRARRQKSEELTNHMQIGVPTARRMLTGEPANQQLRVPISNRRAGLEVLGEWDVLWKESRHQARQECTWGDWGPSSTVEQRWASVSEHKIWINPLVLPALMSCAAAGNYGIIVPSYCAQCCPPEATARAVAAALLPRLFRTKPRSDHKGITGKVRTGDQLLSVWAALLPWLFRTKPRSHHQGATCLVRTGDQVDQSSMPLPTWTRHPYIGKVCCLLLVLAD